MKLLRWVLLVIIAFSVICLLIFIVGYFLFGFGASADPICLFGSEAVGTFLNGENVLTLEKGEIQLPGFSIPATQMSVRDDKLFILDYNEANYESGTNYLWFDIGRISSDGNSIGDQSLEWTGPPHFFNCVNLMVLVYIGYDPEIEAALKKLSGSQFAGASY